MEHLLLLLLFGWMLGPCQRAKKVVKHKSKSNINMSWNPSNNPNESGKDILGIGYLFKNYSYHHHKDRQ